MRPGAILAVFSAVMALGASSPIGPGAVVEVRNPDGSIASDVEVRTVVVDESVNPATVLKRQGGATSCRQIHNWFKWKAAPDEIKSLPDNAKQIFTIGWSRMDKNFCFDGTVVSDSTGKDVSPAVIVGGATDAARVVGWNYQGNVGGTVRNEYENWNGNGRGAHVSAFTVKMDWKCPVATCPAAQAPIFQKELYIRVFADGRAECRNGNYCLAGNEPLPPAWNDL